MSSCRPRERSSMMLLHKQIMQWIPRTWLIASYKCVLTWLIVLSLG
jgi:hypothetical protein